MKKYLLAFVFCGLPMLSQAGIRDRALRAFGPVYTAIVCAPGFVGFGYATFEVFKLAKNRGAGHAK